MKDINDILAAYFSGNISEEDKAYVTEWKAENEEEFTLLSEAWKETVDYKSADLVFKTFDHQKALEKVNSAIDNDKETKIIKLNFYKKVAAACAILLVGLAGFWFVKNNSGSNTLANTNHTPKEINLPDGTTVFLAANSSIDYASDFESNRSVSLKGEAFFEVARDEKHPFVITTDLGEIEVLGTAFNVDANDLETVVSVEHGKVAVRNDKKEVQLTAGESATATKETVSEKTTADENYLSWKTGSFVFENTPLTETVALLNKFYEKQIVLSAEVTNTDNFNGTFDNKDLDVIISAIVLTCNLEAEYGDNEIQLK